MLHNAPTHAVESHSDPPNHAPKGRRRRLFRIVAIVLGVLAGAAALELAIRLYLTLAYRGSLDQLTCAAPHNPRQDVKLSDLIYPSDDPRLIYRLKPNATGRFLGAVVATNSVGFRDDEIQIEKTDRTLRVAGLGDSTMFGWAVERDASYLERLEQEFQRQFGDAWRVEFINTAVPAYMAVQEIELFATCVAGLRPDAVLIQYDINDIYLPYFVFQPGFFAARHLFVADLAGLLRGDYRSPEAVVALNQMDQLPAPYDRLAGWDPLADAYTRLAETCQKMGIPCYVVLLAGEVLEENPEKLRAERYRAIRDLCARLPVKLIDTYPTLARFARENRLTSSDLAIHFPNDRHPTPMHHALIAEALLPRLLEELGPGRLSDDQLTTLCVSPPSILYGKARIRLPKPDYQGLYDAEDWGGATVRWTEPRARVDFVPQGRSVTARYFVGHVSVSERRPVTVALRVDGDPPVSTARHAEQGFYTQTIPIEDLSPTTHTLQIEVAPPYFDMLSHRVMGIGLYPLEFGAEPRPKAVSQ